MFRKNFGGEKEAKVYRYESVNFLIVEEQRVRTGTFCSKSQYIDAGLVHFERNS